ncbi:hypothetical protein CsSME_00053045 [Camellia sinensis var. sinensis]
MILFYEYTSLCWWSWVLESWGIYLMVFRPSQSDLVMCISLVVSLSRPLTRTLWEFQPKKIGEGDLVTGETYMLLPLRTV